MKKLSTPFIPVFLLLTMAFFFSACGAEQNAAVKEVETIEEEISEEVDALEKETEAIEAEMNNLEEDVNELLKDI